MVASKLTNLNLGGISQGAYSECHYTPPMSIRCMTLTYSDMLKKISSLNEPVLDQPMRDSFSSMKSTNGGPPISNSAYPTPTPILPNVAPMLPAPIFNPNEATTRNDLGFTNPFSSQMDIFDANPAVLPTTNYDDNLGWYVNFNDVASQGCASLSAKGAEYEMTASDELMDDAPLMYPNGMVNAEMLSLWSEASAAFRLVTLFYQYVTD